MRALRLLLCACAALACVVANGQQLGLNVSSGGTRLVYPIKIGEIREVAVLKRVDVFTFPGVDLGNGAFAAGVAATVPFELGPNLTFSPGLQGEFVAGQPLSGGLAFYFRFNLTPVEQLKTERLPGEVPFGQATASILARQRYSF